MSLATTYQLFRGDVHSYSQPNLIQVGHVHLNLNVDFERSVLDGAATLRLKSPTLNGDTLVLDSRNLSIHYIELILADGSMSRGSFLMGAHDEILGAAVTIPLANSVTAVRIRYTTSPNASGLQWLLPDQTSGKKHPFLLTQSQEIHARSWIPIQDTPSIRTTFSAEIHIPPELTAVMGATFSQRIAPGLFEFRMDMPVPCYLMALAVGNLDFASTGFRTGVYAEPCILDEAAAEFEDAEQMLSTTERLFGPYHWGRYDLLVLPPSFPLGGMENPCLTFITSTAIVGDKSLNSLMAHELAHSWAGNLVTNATWSDYWLNEGFTTYVESRIIEKIYGAERAEMEDALAFARLETEFKHLPPDQQLLVPTLVGRDPDDACTVVPYIKGSLFLQSLEKAFGRVNFDRFLESYFDHFAFQSITTHQAIEYLKEELFDKFPAEARAISLQEWLHEPGLPPGTHKPVSANFENVKHWATRWLAGEIEANALPLAKWSTYEVLEFFSLLPKQDGREKLAELDRIMDFSESRNSEILCKWLVLALENEYERAYDRVDEFVTNVGRRKFVKPIFQELIRTSEGRRRACRLYEGAYRNYHPITRGAIAKLLQSAEVTPSVTEEVG